MTQPLPDRWTGVPTDKLPPGVRRRYGLDTPTAPPAPQGVLLTLGQQAWAALTADQQAALIQQATVAQVTAQLQQLAVVAQTLPGGDEAAQAVQSAVDAIQPAVDPTVQ